jgi:hypothetical protein
MQDRAGAAMRTATCRQCRQPVLFVVVSNKEGRPPSRMPVDPAPDPAGNVAVHKDVTGTLVGRVLGNSAPLGYERVHMPHFPTTTCQPVHPQVEEARRAAELPEGVTQIAAWKKARAAHAATRRTARGRRPGPQVTGIRIPPPLPLDQEGTT